MKGTRRQPAVAQPPSPTSPAPSKGTSKYANRDGSKIISVPKTPSSAEPPHHSPTVAASMPPPAAIKSQSAPSEPTAPTVSNASGSELAPAINRKKAKRRAKLAAKAAAEAGINDDILPNGVLGQPASSNHPQQTSEAGHSDDEGEVFSGHPQRNGNPSTGASKSKTGRKSKGDDGLPTDSTDGESRRPPSPIPHSSPGRASGISKEKIWNTSSQEERQRIKEFWLGLGEDERKSLVKVEKDAVLKKMKEQQKQTCSCTVCGRKRNAIEEELEGLYDAYYEELESFANQPNPNGDVPPMLGPTGHFGSTAYTSQIMPSKYPPRQPSRGRIVEHCGEDEDDDDGDEDYSEEELDDEEDYSDDEEPEEMHRQRPTEHQTDFFNFGNSLTVQGGILTVADDLLKNDGKKFIEMMEQLAERRMQREEDAKEQFARNYHMNGNNYPAHAHPPPPEDEEEYEDEGEEEYDDSQDEEYDDEEDSMTEEQRMEEGRRMFQIFAARMFEQRVLTAYREKVAKERQEKLLEELAQEDRETEKRKAKKQKEAQKRRDKALQKKQAQAEDKARKDAEKAAEESERLAEEQRRQEEQRQKNEERKKKKEAQRKAEEEERLRKEAERLRRIQEQKERQAEQDRRAREAKEKEKKAKEEAKQREKAARELKEREARERKEKADAERLEKEAKIKMDKEAKETKEAQKRADKSSHKAASLVSAPVPTGPARRPSQALNPAPALPQNQQAAVASPQLPTAVPALPKLPTPQKPRRPSQQESFVSGVSYPAPLKAATPIHTSPGPGGFLSKGSSSQGQSLHSQTTSPLGTSLPTSTSLPHPFGMAHPPLNQQYPPGVGSLNAPPGLGGPRVFPDFPDQMYQQSPFGFRQAGQQHPQVPPGLGLPMTPGRGLGHGPQPPPGLSGQQPDFPPMSIFGSLPKEPSPLSSHSRQASASFDSPVMTTPIARPAPIGRPGSVVQGHRGSTGSPGGPSQDNSDEFNPPHLGSSALLDDLDDPLMDELVQDTRSSRRSIPGPPPASRFPPPAGSPFGMSHSSPFGPSLWSQPAGPTIVNQGFGSAFGQPAPPPGFSSISDALNLNSPWGAPSRNAPVNLNMGHNLPKMRMLLKQACLDLAGSKASMPDEKADDQGRRYLPITAVKSRVDSFCPPGATFTVDDLMSMTSTEGNPHNGGGSFDTQNINGELFVRWIHDDTRESRAIGRSVGEIGSPIVGTRG